MWCQSKFNKREDSSIIDSNSLRRMNFFFIGNRWRRIGKNLTIRRARERREREADEEVDMEDELDKDGEAEEEPTYGPSDPHDTPRMLRELLENSTHIASMMGSMQREMVETNAKLDHLTTQVSNLETTSVAQSWDIQELIR